MSEVCQLAVIRRIAEVAHAIGWQAGVGASETAGMIVSYLASHPESIADFIAGGSVFDWPEDWHSHGCLTWLGADGNLHTPEEVRRHRIIKKLERGA